MVRKGLFPELCFGNRFLDRKNASVQTNIRFIKYLTTYLKKTVVSENPYVGTTHQWRDDKYVVFINYSDKVQSLKLKWNKSVVITALWHADRLDAGTHIMRIE